MHKKCQFSLQAEDWTYLGCATEGGGCAVVLYVFFAESEVSQDNVPLRIKQNILWLQVTVGTDERTKPLVRARARRLFSYF